MTTSTLDVALVISSLNEGSALVHTLNSVFAGSGTPRETIVVDDGGTDGSCEALADQELWRDRNVIVKKIRRSGVAAARNIGAALATAPNLMFLDAHCALDFDCLTALYTKLDAAPYDSMHVPAIRDVDDDESGCGARLIDASLRIRWLRPSEAVGPLPIAPGGCLAMSRSTFDRLGGFGHFRELGLEDVDFSLRAWRLGIDVLGTPEARLAHRFRPYPTYPLNSASRGYNLARLSLVHFDGPRRDQCLRTLIGTPRAAGAIVDALHSDWETTRDALAASSTRSIDDYFATFGDWT